MRLPVRSHPAGGTRVLLTGVPVGLAASGPGLDAQGNGLLKAGAVLSFTVELSELVTGETGAGKSPILDALRLAGAKEAKEALVLPLATGMTVTMSAPPRAAARHTPQVSAACARDTSPVTPRVTHARRGEERRLTTGGPRRSKEGQRRHRGRTEEQRRWDSWALTPA